MVSFLYDVGTDVTGECGDGCVARYVWCVFVSSVISMINVLAVVLVSFLQHAAGLGLSSLSMQYASMLFVMTSLAGLLSRRRRHGQTQQPAATAMG